MCASTGDQHGLMPGSEGAAGERQANLGTRGIATWAASWFFLRGEEGQIGRISLFAMSKTARAVADPNSGFAAGVFPPSVLAGWGITTKTYGYAQSRTCVK